MSVSLGTLMLNLELSTEAYEAQLEQARQMALNVGRDIERSLQSATKGGLRLNPTIDQKGLSGLTTQIQSHLNTTAFKLTFDTSNLDSLEQRFDNLQKKQRTYKPATQNAPEKTYRHEVQVKTQELEKAVSESIEKGFKKAAPKVKSGGAFGVGNIVRGFQEGIGQTYSAKITSGVINNFEKEFGMTLDKIGEKFGSKVTKLGKFTGDRLAKKMGFEDGLRELQALTPEFNKFFDEIFDEKIIGRKFSVLETQIGKLIDDLLMLKDVSQQVSNVKGVGSAVADIATSPLEGLQKRKIRIVKQSAERAKARAEEIEAGQLPAGTKTATFAIGGFAGVKGKSSQAVAERLQLMTGTQNRVIPLDNPNTDLSVNVGEGKLKFLLDGLKRLIEHNVIKGYNPDAVEAAAQAIATVRANPDTKVNFAGYSAGGFVAEEATKIAREAGVDARGVGIGTPRFGGKVRLTTQDEYRSVLGEGDILAKPTRFLGGSDVKIVAQGGQGHKLSSYLGSKDSQQEILKQLGMQHKVSPDLQNKAPYEIVGFEKEMEALTEDLGKVLGDQSMTMFFKKTGLYKTHLQQVKTHRAKIANLLEEATGQIAEQLEAYDEALVEIETYVKQVFSVQEEVAPAVKAKMAGKKPVNQQTAPPPEFVQPLPALKTKPLTEEELGQFNVQSLQQLSRYTGLDPKQNKAGLVKSLLESDAKEVRAAIAKLRESQQRKEQAPPSTADQSILNAAKDAEKRLNDTLREFLKAEGDRRQQILDSALNEIEQTIKDLEKLSASDSAETRKAAGSQKGRLSGLKSEFKYPVNPERLQASYDFMVQRTASAASIAPPQGFTTPELAGSKTAFQGKTAAGVYNSKANKITLPQDKLTALQRLIDKQISTLSEEGLKTAISTLSTLSHEVYHGAQFGFSGMSKADLMKAGTSNVLTPEVSDKEVEAFTKVKGSSVEPLIQKSVEGGRNNEEYKSFSEEQKAAYDKVTAELEKGAYNFQAKVIAEIYKQIEEAGNDAQATVADVFEKAIANVTAQLESQKAALTQITAEAPAVAATTGISSEELNKFNVEILKEIARLTGQKTTGKKADLVQNLMAGNQGDLETAIASVKPMIEPGVKGGQKLKKTEFSDKEKAGLAYLKQVEDTAKANLAKIDALEENLRKAEIEKLKAYLKENIERANKYVTGKTFSADARFGASKSKQELERIQKQLSGGVDVDEINLARVDVSKLLGKAGKMAASEDAIVNTAGFAGSVIGGHLGGHTGQLAGDLAGALLARKGITDYKTLQNARKRVSVDPSFQKGNPLEKLWKLYKGVMEERKASRTQRTDNLIGDTAGWAIGNLSANMLGMVPGVANIPFKGAVAAMAAVPKVVDASRKIRNVDDISLARVGDTQAETGGIKQKIAGLLSRLQKQQRLSTERTYQLIVKEVANLSNVTLKPGDIPKLVVDNKRLGSLGARALYDIKKNQIIITEEVAQMLSGTIDDIQKQQQAIADIVHESRHAAQFAFGKSSLRKVAATGQAGVSMIPFADAPNDVKYSALRSVQVANQQAGGLLPKRVQRAIAATEADAYTFEKIALPRVMDKLGSPDKEGFSLKLPNIPIPDSLKTLTQIFNESRKGAKGLGDAFNELTKEFDSLLPGTSKLIGGLKGIVGGFVAFQVINQIIPMFGQLISGMLDTAKQMERFENVINFTSGGSGKGASNLKFIREEAKRLNIDLRNATESYAQFSGSTQGTALEGDQTNKIFSALSQASSVRQLDPEREKLVFGALSQIASKGVVSMEELRQQLGESLPGAMNIAARSMGMTTQEFNKLVSSGQLLAEDFLPKFAQQLSAESSTGLGAAANSTQASINRLNNSFTEMQAGIGKALLPLQKISFNGLASSLEFVSKHAQALGTIFVMVSGVVAFNLAKSLLALPAVAKVVGASMAFLSGTFTQVLASLKAFAIQMAVYTAAIEVAKYLSRAFYDTSGAIGDFAKSSVANLDAYKNALAEARGETEKFNATKPQPVNFKDIATNAVGAVGNIANTAINMVPGAGFIKGAIGTKGLGLPSAGDAVSAVMDKESNDRSVAMGNIFAANEQRLSAVTSMLGNNKQGVAELGQLKGLDRQIEQVQMKRRNLVLANPNDKEGVRALQAEEQGLLAQREKVAKPISILQEGLASDVEGLKNLKKQLQEASTQATNPEDQAKYAQKIGEVQAALDSTQKAQDNFNTAMKGSLTTLDAFAKAFQTIVDKMEDANRGAESFYNKSRASIAEGELSGQLTSGQADVQRALANEGKISAEKNTAGDAIKQAQAELEGQNYQEILKSMGLNQNTGQSQLKTVLERVQSPKEKAVLENLIKLKDLQDNYDSLTAQAAEAKVSTRNSKQAEFMQRLDRETKDAEASFKQMQNSKQMSLIKEQTGIITKGAKNQFFSEADQALAEAGIGEKQSKLAVAAVDEQTRATQNQIDEYEKAYKAGEVSAEEYHDKVRDLTTQLSDLRVEKAKALQGVEEATARKIQATNRKLIEQSELALKRRETAIALSDTGARQGIRSGLLQSGLSEENQLKANVAENAVDTSTSQKTIELVKFEMAENDRLRKAGAINEKTYLEKNMDLKKRLASESLRLTDLQIAREKAAQELFNKQVDIRVNKAREASAAIVRGLEAEKAGFEAVTKSLDIQAQKLQAIMGVEQARAALAQAYSDNAQAGLQNEIKGLGTQLDLMKRAKDEQDPKKKRELQKVLSATGVGYSGGEKEVLLGKQEKERALDQEKMNALETQRQLMERQFTLAQKQLEIDLKRADIAAKMASLEAQIAYTKQEQTVRQAQGELEKAVRSRDPEKIRDAQINLQDQQALLAPMRDQMNLAFQGVMAQQELAGFAKEKLGLEQQTQRVQSNTQMKNLQGEISDRAVSQALEQIDVLGSVARMPDFQQLGSESGGAVALIVPPLTSLATAIDQNTGVISQNNAITENNTNAIAKFEAKKALKEFDSLQARASDLVGPGNQFALQDSKIAFMKKEGETGADVVSRLSAKSIEKGRGTQKDYLVSIDDTLKASLGFLATIAGNTAAFSLVGGAIAGGIDPSKILQPPTDGLAESPVEVAAQQMATSTTFSPEETKDSSRFMKLKPGYTMPAPAKMPTFDTSGMQFLNGYLPSDSPAIRNASPPQMAPTAGGSSGGFGDLVNVLKMFAQQVATAATSPRSLTINGSQNPTQDAANFWAQQRKMEIQEGGY